MLLDWCTFPSGSCSSTYLDRGHGGVWRTVVGDLDHGGHAMIEGCYVARELADDGGPQTSVGRPWRVPLTLIKPMKPEGGGRWFFGAFSLKEASGRHKDFYVRYLPGSKNKALEFYEIETPLARTPVNVWERVLPRSQVTWSCSQQL